MVAQVGNLQVRVGADISGLSTGMRRAQREVAQSAGAMKRSVSDLQLSFKEVATFSSRAFRTGALLFAGTFGARKLLEMADAAKTLSAQLRLATSQFGSFEQANKDVQAIAERSRSDLLATADLYAALMRNSDQFGATQAQVARVTETVSKAFKISGASADEAANATRQLVQAFQSGRLQGDEFRSMMENAPRLARLLADSLGKTVGELRNMSKEGKLTADVLVRAFSDRKFTDGIDAEFRALPVTFDQAMGQLYNAALITFSEFDRGGQFSQSIANFVSDGADGFERLGQSAHHFGEQVADTFAAIEEIRNELAALHTDGIGSFLGLTNATYGWRDALADTLGVIDGVANAFANLANAPGNLIRLGLGQPIINNPSNMRGSFLEKTNQRRVDAARQQIMARTPRDMLAEFGLNRAPPPFHPSASGAKAKKGRTRQPPRDRSADTAYQFQREQMQADADILRASQDLALSSEQRADIALKLIDIEHAMQAAEIDDRVRRAERDFAEKKITAGALKEVEAQAGKLRAANDAKTAIEKQVFVEERLARAEQAQFEALDQQRGFALDALRAADQMAETAAEHRTIQMQILDAEIEQRRLELEHEKQLAIRNGATADEIRVIQDKIDHLSTERAQGAAGIAMNNRGPYQDWLASLPTTAAKAQEAFERLETQGFDGLIDAALALSDGFDSAKKALLDTLKQFFLGLARIELQKGLAQLLPAGGFKIPGLAGGGTGVFGGIPGVDRNLLSLNGIPIARVSYGERFSIGNDNSPAMRAGGNTQIFNIRTPDANSFMRSETQIARAARRRLGV
ncbi:MAG TPA: tape measure protein [Sphingomicrobium sp.]|nr:tape measure protein [Sphingomicrobium sp.]